MKSSADALVLEPAGQKRTLVSTAYDRLRHDVVRGVLKPGDRLRFNYLADTYGFGASTLREALSRLVGDGLAVFEDQRGFSVAVVSRERLIDLLQMRLLLEEKGICLSVERGGVEWEVGVMSAFHRLSKAHGPVSVDPRLIDEEWEGHHAAFHRSLLAACGSALLLQYRETLYLQGDRYRRLYHSYSARQRDHLGEHRQLMEAALRRDAAAIVRLIREHLETTVRDVLASDFVKEEETETPD
jgi:GntR family transcriptional regulator, carbon starvation induced regulator